MCLKCDPDFCNVCMYNRIPNGDKTACICDTGFDGHLTETHDFKEWCTTCTEAVINVQFSSNYT